MAIFSFHNSILLGGIWSSGVIDNATVSVNHVLGFLDRFKGILLALWGIGMLGDDLDDELADFVKYFDVVFEEIKLADPSVIINKENIVEMAI